MLLINKAARCIDLKGKGGAKYRLLPAGEAVEVPSEVAGRAFAKSLIASGDIAIVRESVVEVDAEAEAKAKAEAEAAAKAEAEAEAEAKAKGKASK